MHITAKLEVSILPIHGRITFFNGLIFCWMNDINKATKNSGKCWKSAAL